MAKQITMAHCKERFRVLDRVVQQWDADESDDVKVQWGSVKVKAFTRSLEIALERFLDSMADDGLEVAIDATPFVIAVDRLFKAYLDFKRLVSEESPSCSPAGTDAFWSAYQCVAETIRQAPSYSQPQPISELVAMDVTHSQIANIYGWKTEYGDPDTNKVLEEIRNPGTHYQPESWVHPASQKRLKFFENEWKERLKSSGKRRKTFESMGENEPKPAVASHPIEYMISVGAPAEQIARCHGISIEEAQEKLDKFEKEKPEMSSLAAV